MLASGQLATTVSRIPMYSEQDLQVNSIAFESIFHLAPDGTLLEAELEVTERH